MLCLCFVTRGLAPGHTSQDGQVSGKLFSGFFRNRVEGRLLLEEAGKIL